MTVTGPIGTLAGRATSSSWNLDFFGPDLAQEISKNLNAKLLAGTSPISKAEGSVSCVVADRKRLPLHDAECRAECAVCYFGSSPVAYGKEPVSNGHFANPSAFAFASPIRSLVGASKYRSGLNSNGFFHCRGSKFAGMCGVIA